MTDILIYLLKVSLAISLVSIPYYLWLRQDAALNIKRIYMVGGIILSWLFPLIVIRKPQAISSFTEAFLIDPDAVALPATSTLPETATGTTISVFSIVLIVYFFGLFILAMRHFIMFRRLSSMDRQGDNEDRNVVYTNSKQIFTLFSKIFIPEDLRSGNDYNSILIHEKAHLQQLHMVDLIIAESNLLLTWFNPFSWLISRMIKENHEHLADRTVLSKGVNPAHYKAQLLNHATGVELFRLSNQFNHSLTKKRFQMMKKIKSPKKGFVKYLALIPAIVIALGLFTAASVQQKTVHGKVVFEDGSPAIGASIVVAGGTIGTVVDLDGTFSLELEGNPELVISFVGFKSARVHTKDLAKKDVVLHQKAFKIDLRDVKAADASSKQPVYVVDGKIVSEIESLSSDDIAAVNVIKDPNSPEAKKYNAKDGLIIVTMKKSGKSKKLKEVQETDDMVFYIVEDMPSFPGGKEMLKGYIYKNLKYPEKAKKKGMSGEVSVKFTVTIKGQLKDISVKESSNEIFNDAAMDVFRDMPVWNSGKQRGKPVNVQVIVPVRFNAK